MGIEFVNLKRQYESIAPEINAAISAVLQSCHFIGGPEKEAFELEFAKAHGSAYSLGVANGTDSLMLILRAIGLEKDNFDEVIVPANSFIATSEAVTAAGARVRFCDVSETTFNLCPESLEDMLQNDRTGKIKAVMPVHLYGRIAPMDKISQVCNKHSVKLIEDSAQAHLAKLNGKFVGSFGLAASFSFYPGKNLGAYGDAGAIITNNEDLYLKIKKLANHGRISKYDHDMEGFNSRLDALQAAVLRVKLRHLPKWVQARQKIALQYNKLLSNIPDLILPEIPHSIEEHVFHLYVLRSKQRELIMEALKKNGVETLIHYPISLPRLKAYNYLSDSEKNACPVADKLSGEIFSLPIYPELTDQEQLKIVDIIKGVLIK